MIELTCRDFLISELQALPKDRETLKRTENPLEYEWRRRSIADRERLLAQLDTQERLMIERILINREKAAALTGETVLTVREIQSATAAALEKLLQLKYGAAYSP